MSDYQTEVTIVTASAVMAVLAIAAPLLSIGQPVQAFAAFGGILLGPGGLAYRIATGARWPESLMVGVALNIAALMVIALVAIALHFWHPKLELIIPVTTCVLAVVIYGRAGRYGSRGGGYRRS